MSSTEKAVVIFAEITGKKKYISGQQTKSNNQYLVTITEDILQAVNFSPSEAKNYIKKIFNPYDRVFKTEILES